METPKNMRAVRITRGVFCVDLHRLASPDRGPGTHWCGTLHSSFAEHVLCSFRRELDDVLTHGDTVRVFDCVMGSVIDLGDGSPLLPVIETHANGTLEVGEFSAYVDIYKAVGIRPLAGENTPAQLRRFIRKLEAYTQSVRSTLAEPKEFWTPDLPIVTPVLSAAANTTPRVRASRRVPRATAKAA